MPTDDEASNSLVVCNRPRKGAPTEDLYADNAKSIHINTGSQAVDSATHELRRLPSERTV